MSSKSGAARRPKSPKSKSKSASAKSAKSARVDVQAFAHAHMPGEFWFDVSFFLEKNKQRQGIVEDLVDAVQMTAVPSIEGPSRPVFLGQFGSHAIGRSVIVSISEVKYDEDPVNYYVTLHVHGSERSEPDPDEHGIDWIYLQLEELAGNDPTLLFFDAEAEIEELPPQSSVVALPLTIGGRALSVAGVEYATDVRREGVDRFRWTKRDKGAKINVAYTRGSRVADLAQMWKNERQVVLGFIREVFGT